MHLGAPMFQEHRRPAAVIMLFGLAASACRDLATGSVTSIPERDPAASQADAPSTYPQQVPSTQHVCWISERTDAGPHLYRYSRRALRFPASALDSSGRTQVVRYRWHRPGEEEIQRFVNCRIPRTDEALRMIDRRFKMEDQRRKARRSGQGDDGALTIQYTVAPIFTPGGGNEDPNDCNWNVCDASMGDGSGTGGDYGDPGFDGTYRPECEHTPNGKCVTREVNPIEWAALKPRIENINDSRPQCTGAKEALRWAYDQKREAQRIRFWDGWDPEAQDDGSPGQRLGERVSDSDGPFIEYDS